MNKYIKYEDNKLEAQIQKGPILENGENGCQVDDIIQWSRDLVAKLNSEFPCRENSIVLTKLDEALMWLDARKKDRTARGVEGVSKN